MLTAKQRKALNLAPASARAGMRTNFLAQNKNVVNSAQNSKTGQNKTARSARAGKGQGGQKVMFNRMLDAFSPEPRPLALAMGYATALTGRATYTLGIPENEGRVIVFNPAVTTVHPCQTFRFSAAGTYIATSSELLGVGAIYTTPPEEVLISKGSIRYRDVTRALDAGGVTRILKTAQSLSISNPPSQDQVTDLLGLVTQNPRMVSYGTELRGQAHTWHSHMVNVPVASSFQPFNARGISAACGDPTWTTTIVVIEPFSTSRDVVLDVGLGCYTRYDAANVLTHMARPIPNQSLGVEQAIHSAAQAVGSWSEEAFLALGRGASEALTGAGRYFTGRALATGARALADAAPRLALGV